MASDKAKLEYSFNVRVTEEVYKQVELRTEEMQRKAPVGMIITVTDVVRSALLRGLGCKDDCQ